MKDFGSCPATTLKRSAITFSLSTVHAAVQSNIFTISIKSAYVTSNGKRI